MSLLKTCGRALCGVAPAVSMAWLVAALGAATAQAAGELPKAETVLEKYIEALGGREAQMKIKNRVTKGTFEIVGSEMKGDLTIYSARPNKMYFVLESEALGKIERGTSGDLAWELSVMGGPSIKEGAEKTDMLREANFDKFLKWKDVYDKAECVAEEEVDGKTCYKLLLTPKDSKSQAYYFDKEAGLIVKVELNVQTQMGEIAVESHLSDYRKVGDVLVPHKVRTLVMNQERLMTTTSVEHNVDLPADRFDPPAEVREAMKEAKKPEAKPETP